MDGEVFSIIVLCAVIICVCAAGVAHEVTESGERQFACVQLGYNGYSDALDACFTKGKTLVMYPYKEAFDRQ